MDREEAQRHYPVPTFRHDLDPFTDEGGESQAQIRSRALAALELLWLSPASRLLVVSHGGFLNSLLHELTGSRLCWFDFGDTAYVTIILSRSSHTVRVTGVNLYPHLPD